MSRPFGLHLRHAEESPLRRIRPRRHHALRMLAILIGMIWCGVASGAAALEPRQAAVEVLAGGIGEEEQQALAARERDFNLKLVFSLSQGNYLADVDIVVSDAKGAAIVRRNGTGPWVLVQLPAGSYTVTASQRGTIVTRAVRIGPRRLRTEYLRWPADPAEDLPVSRWLDPD